MPDYIAQTKTWLSHENRMVEAGEKFTTTFPDGMKLSGNIELVGGLRNSRKTKKLEPDTNVGSDDTGGEDTGLDDTGSDEVSGD